MAWNIKQAYYDPVTGKPYSSNPDLLAPFAVNPDTGKQDFLDANPDYTWFAPDVNGGSYVTAPQVKAQNAPAATPTDTQTTSTAPPVPVPVGGNVPPWSENSPRSPQTYTTVAGTGYAPIQGYDYAKLSDPTHTGTGKYNSDVKWFSQGLAATGAQPGKAGLKAVSDWINTHGGHAEVAGDGISINGGKPVDVLTNYNDDTGTADAWWFGEGNLGEGSATGAGGGGGAAGDPFAGTPTTLPGALDINSLSSILSLGSTFGGPGGAGVFGSDSLQQVGQDPFSQLITGGLTNLIADSTSRLHSTPQQQAQAFEAARSPYEMARKVQLRNAQDQLASRGLLGEPGQESGIMTGALQRIEEGLAPAYTGAIADEFGRMYDREAAAANTLGGALTSATNRQSALSDVAIRTLEQNRIFNQFIATYGLDKVKVLADIANGQGEQYLKLLELELKKAELAAGGYI